MLNTLGIVQVSSETSQIASCFLRKLGGKSLLEWVVRRVTDCQRLDGVIVAIGDGPQKQSIAQLAPPDVPVFVGSQEDVLGRFASAVDEFPAKSIVRIRVDTPFVDPALIDALVTASDVHPECDCIAYCSRNGRPAILSPVGLFAEWFTAKALRKAARRAIDPQDRRDVTRFLYAHPESFRMRLLPMPERLDRDDLRLRVDLEEDWDHTQDIFEALGSHAFDLDASGAESADWQQITGLLDQQPAMRRRMALLNRAESKAWCFVRAKD